MLLAIMRPHSGFRLASPAPCADYDGFDDFVFLAGQARTAYRRVMAQDLALWGGHRSLDIRMCSWKILRRQGVQILLAAVKHAPGGLEWAHCANDALVFALKASTCSYAWHFKRFILSVLIEILNSQLDCLLGYPDCCWGWTGPGVLRDLVSSSFHAMISPPRVLFVAKTKWPLHMVALLMARHPRLGAKSGIRDVDEHLVCRLLQLAVKPAPPQLCAGW